MLLNYVETEMIAIDKGMRKTKQDTLNRQEVKLNMDKLVKDIKLKSKELQAIVKYYGVENMRFYANIITLKTETTIEAANSGIGKREFVECRIDESIYKIEEWYKITLVPVEDSGKYGYEHYYITDLVLLINEGLIRIKDFS